MQWMSGGAVQTEGPHLLRRHDKHKMMLKGNRIQDGFGRALGKRTRACVCVCVCVCLCVCLYVCVYVCVVLSPSLPLRLSLSVSVSPFLPLCLSLSLPLFPSLCFPPPSLSRAQSHLSGTTSVQCAEACGVLITLKFAAPPSSVRQ